MCRIVCKIICKPFFKFRAVICKQCFKFLAVWWIVISGTLPNFDIDVRNFNISVYLDIEVTNFDNFDFEVQTISGTILNFNIDIVLLQDQRSKFWETSISKMNGFDIEAVRYRRNFDIEVYNVDIEVYNFDIVVSRYWIYIDVEECTFDIGIYRYRSFGLRYQRIFNIVFFDIGVSFLDPAWAAVARYWTQIVVYNLLCIKCLTPRLLAAAAAVAAHALPLAAAAGVAWSAASNGGGAAGAARGPAVSSVIVNVYLGLLAGCQAESRAWRTGAPWTPSR